METYVDTGYCMMDAAWGAILQFTGHEDPVFGMEFDFNHIEGWTDFEYGANSDGPWTFKTYAYKGNYEYAIKGKMTKSRGKDEVFFIAEIEAEQFAELPVL